jgi:hypothetical protein
MKKTVLIVLLYLIALSCKHQSELGKEFACDTSEIKNLSEYFDFKKNFKIHIPSSWKTELYYDDFQSEIFTADTTKQLSETFILDAAFNFGELNFDLEFHQKTDSILTVSNLKKIKEGTLKFKSKPAFWYLVKGTKNGFEYHQFNILVKNTSTTYFTANSEIYGTENVNKRICESISLMEKIEFLQ